MIIMAEIAPKGTFDDNSEYIFVPREKLKPRPYYDYDRNYEETA